MVLFFILGLENNTKCYKELEQHLKFKYMSCIIFFSDRKSIISELQKGHETQKRVSEKDNN